MFVLYRAVRGLRAGTPWTGDDSTWIKGAAHAMTAQLVIGVLLYATSPVMRTLLDQMGPTLHDRGARLLAIEHPIAMTVAVGLTHMGSAIARKGATDGAKHKRAAIFTAITLAVILAGIPWGRPLFRF